MTDHCMYSLLWRHLLPQHRDVVVSANGSVQCVLSKPRRITSMGIDAVEGDCNSGDGQEWDVYDTIDRCEARPGVSHKACIDTLVGPGVQQSHLASAFLLSGSAEKTHPAADAVCLQSLCSGQECRNGGSGNQVVSASMANAWQGIVLGVVYYDSAAGASFDFECRLEVVSMSRDVVAKCFQHSADCVVRMCFLKRQLWVAVNLCPWVSLERQ